MLRGEKSILYGMLFFMAVSSIKRPGGYDAAVPTLRRMAEAGLAVGALFALAFQRADDFAVRVDRLQAHIETPQARHML